MTGVKTPGDTGKGGAADARAEREKRLAEALRANLRRRKAGAAERDDSNPDARAEAKRGGDGD